jgi:D-alanyl-D-alanine carboxypeptidase
MTWPADTMPALEAFYGPIRLGATGLPTRAWEKETLTTIPAPYPLALAWKPDRQVTKVTCHRLVAQSLTRILSEILSHCETVEALRLARLHLFGGCYNYRLIGGSHRLSVHSFGAAVDFDPENNPLGRVHVDGGGMIPRTVVDIFEAEGWRWGGTFRRRPDCMHFQATA